METLYDNELLLRSTWGNIDRGFPKLTERSEVNLDKPRSIFPQVDRKKQLITTLLIVWEIHTTKVKKTNTNTTSWNSSLSYHKSIWRGDFYYFNCISIENYNRLMHYIKPIKGLSLAKYISVLLLSLSLHNVLFNDAV